MGVIQMERLGCTGTIILVLLITFIFMHATFILGLLGFIVFIAIIAAVVSSRNEKEKAKLANAKTVDASMSKETSFQFNSLVYKPVTSSDDDVPNKEMILRTDPETYVKSRELSTREQKMVQAGYSMENIQVARINVVQTYNARYRLYNRYYRLLKIEADITTVPNREMTVLLKIMVMDFYHRELGIPKSLQSHSFDEKLIQQFVQLCPEVNMSITYFDSYNITNEQFLNQMVEKGCLNAFKNIMIGYDLN
jgi:hypothetical protein